MVDNQQQNTVLICIKTPNLFNISKPVEIGVVGIFDSVSKALESKYFLEDKYEFKDFEFFIAPSSPLIKNPKDEREYNWPIGYSIADRRQ